MTTRGRKAFDGLTARQVPWVNDLARGLSPRGIETAVSVLQRIEERLAPVSATRLQRR